MNGSKLTWTEDVIDDLRRLWARGDSATMIGEALSVTRNAVLGKVHRLGLASHKPARSLDPRPPRHAFVPRSLKPRSAIGDPDEGRPFVNISSAITGGYLAAKRKKRTEPELTKTELRAQLTLAVLNTK